MTEQEWRTGPVPDLLAYARGLKDGPNSGFWPDGTRKHMLLACGLARLYGKVLSRKTHKAIDSLEAAADDETRTKSDGPAVERSSLEEWLIADIKKAGDWPARKTCLSDLWTLFLGDWSDLKHADRPQPYRTYQGWRPVIHDVFNPFQSVAVESAWLTPAVTALAKAAYEERAAPYLSLDTARLVALAGALQEAGCNEAIILDHCRRPRPQPHVRGCWVVDMILGKI